MNINNFLICIFLALCSGLGAMDDPLLSLVTPKTGCCIEELVAVAHNQIKWRVGTYSEPEKTRIEAITSYLSEHHKLSPLILLCIMGHCTSCDHFLARKAFLPSSKREVVAPLLQEALVLSATVRQQRGVAYILDNTNALACRCYGEWGWTLRDTLGIAIAHADKVIFNMLNDKGLRKDLILCTQELQEAIRKDPSFVKELFTKYVSLYQAECIYARAKKAGYRSLVNYLEGGTLARLASRDEKEEKEWFDDRYYDKQVPVEPIVSPEDLMKKTGVELSAKSFKAHKAGRKPAWCSDLTVTPYCRVFNEKAFRPLVVKPAEPVKLGCSDKILLLRL